MNFVLQDAERALREGCFPVACALVFQGRILSSAYLRNVDDPRIHHPVMKALCEAHSNPHLKNATLYTNLEPCMMCLGAIINCGITSIVFALENPDRGACLRASWRDTPIRDPHVCFPDITSSFCREDSLELVTRFFMQREGGQNVRSRRSRPSALRDLALGADIAQKLQA